MIIVIANQKGGVGKSTIATNLAVELNTDIKKSLQLIDHDISHVSLNFMKRRSNDCKLKMFDAYVPSDINHFVEMLEDDKYNTTIVDLGGFTDDLAKAALIYSDMIIVPTSISTHDMDGNIHFMDTLDKLQILGIDMNIYFVANRVNPSAKMPSILKELNYIEDRGYKILGSLPQYNMFSDCHGDGMSIIEYAPESGAGVAMNILTEQILKEINNG